MVTLLLQLGKKNKSLLLSSNIYLSCRSKLRCSSLLAKSYSNMLGNKTRIKSSSNTRSTTSTPLNRTSTSISITMVGKPAISSSTHLFSSQHQLPITPQVLSHLTTRRVVGESVR